MLRAALSPPTRAVLPRPGRQALLRPEVSSTYVRTLAASVTLRDNTKPSINNPTPPVLPGTESKTATLATPPPPGAVTPGVPSSPPGASNNAIHPRNVPLTPPPPESRPQSIPPVSLPPGGSGSSPSAPKKKPRRFRTYLLTLLLLTGLGYGGGVWYSLVSDNFHDFFTEYIPFGEDAVLYFEEREFRKRFPRVLNNTRHTRDSDHKVTIPSKSGMSWKVAHVEQEGSDQEKKGRHMSAVDDHHSSPPPPESTREKLTEVKHPKPREFSSQEAATTAPRDSTRKSEAKPEAEVASGPVKGPTPASALSAPASDVPKGKKMPEVNEPSVYVPVTTIDPISIEHAEEPLVQDLVKIMNDIITVINADNVNGMLTSTINKAKSELSQVGQRILDLKASEQNAATAKLRDTEKQFDDAARELIRRLENEMQEQEAKWRDEYESERRKIEHTYEERLQAEVGKIKQITEQRSRNQLMEQAIALKRDFISDVKNHVERERNGRLAKLSELSSSVSELEKLTSEWNAVVDASLQTQHLQVAVEAVRSSLEKANQAQPFIRELAALKEIAQDDPVVNSAIASIAPVAYQRGVPSSAQIVDRFRRVADEVRKASLLPENAGIASHAASVVLSKVMFRKQGRVVGDDVESVLTRTETLLEEGNLDDAAREMNSLTGWAKTLSRDWLAEVRRVLEVRQALDVISTEARLKSLKVD